MLFRSEEYPTIDTYDWAPGSKLVLYTDGLLTANDGEKNLYERKHLRKILEKAATGRARQMFDAIIADRHERAGHLEPEDDTTLVVCEALQ